MANSLFGRRYWGLLLLLAFLWYPVNGFSALQNGREREVRRIGVIVFAAPFLKSYEGLRSGLQDKGYKLDAELVFSVHSIEREVSKVAPLIEKFAADDFDLIYTVTTSVTQAVKLYIQENQIDIPTVFAVVADPVGSEIVTSLRHPGANITGISHVSKELLPQRLLRFKKAFPAIKRMALLFNPEDEVSKSSLNQPGLRLVAKDLEVDMVVKRVRNSDEVQSLCGGLAATDIDSIFMLPDVLSVACFNEFVGLSRRLRIPLMVIDNRLLKRGGVIGYSPDFYAVGVQAATIVDQILKGASAGDIAVQNPEKVRLVVSLQEAQTLNLKISNEILLQADEVLR